MAMDSLKNLSNNVPGWLTRLDDLSGQIEQRQKELASIAAAEPRQSSETKSLKNKGSTESLKPKDDGPPLITGSNEPAKASANGQDQSPTEDSRPENTTKPSTSAQDLHKSRPASSSPGPGGIAASHKPTRDAIAAAHSRAKAQVKKKVKTASMISVENAPQSYRTRSMIIVYYDSYVQGFFDDLVRFISSSRNLMRKAKMAARVAQIKKMAEMEVSTGPDGVEDPSGTEPLPSLKFMSTRRLGAMGRPGFGPPGTNEQPDIYDNLDKGLEFVQSTCEHGAHQFLRDADCNDEIKKIQERLCQVLDMARKGIERIQTEEPELAKETGELTKPRSHRPISIRRELSNSQQDLDLAAKEGAVRLEATPSARSQSSFIEPADHPLEHDNNQNGEDEGIDIGAELPKLQYRSTRAMRAWAQ